MPTHIPSVSATQSRTPAIGPREAVNLPIPNKKLLLSQLTATAKAQLNAQATVHDDRKNLYYGRVGNTLYAVARVTPQRMEDEELCLFKRPASGGKWTVKELGTEF